MRAVAVGIILGCLLLLGGCRALEGAALGESEKEIKFKEIADKLCELGVTKCSADRPFYQFSWNVCVNAAELKAAYDMENEQEATYLDKLYAIRAGEESLECGVIYPDRPYLLTNGSCADKAQLDAYLKGRDDVGFDDVPGPVENGGVGDCTPEKREALAGKSPSSAPPPTETAEEGVPCTKEGYCFPACSADHIILTRYKCRRDTCFPVERVNCMDEYQVSCIDTYVTLHGKWLTDATGNPLLTGYCYGRPEKLG